MGPCGACGQPTACEWARGQPAGLSIRPSTGRTSTAPEQRRYLARWARRAHGLSRRSCAGAATRPSTLGHYEGRGWRGFHHQATLSIAAYEFLMAQKLKAGSPVSGKKKLRRTPNACRSRGLHSSGQSSARSVTCPTRSPPCACNWVAALASRLGHCPHCNWLSPRLRL